MTREDRIAQVARILEETDRSKTLVNYWWETTGWVKPDWRRIAEAAVSAWEDIVEVR